METLHPQIVPGLIIVDGPIGAGKTTFIERLRFELSQKGARVEIIQEIIPEDLTEYYKSPETKSFEFQTKFIQILADQYYKMAQKLESGLLDFVLCDRYFASTRGFIEYQRSKGFLTDVQVEILYAKIKLLCHAIPFFPELFIYLDEKAFTCLERIKARGRVGETTTNQDILLETNDFIRRFNSIPYFGVGDDSYVNFPGWKLSKNLCQTAEIERVIGKIGMMHLFEVQEESTKGTVLPHKRLVTVSEELSRGRVFHHLRDQIARDSILLVATDQNPDDIHASVEEEEARLPSH